MQLRHGEFVIDLPAVGGPFGPAPDTPRAGVGRTEATESATAAAFTSTNRAARTFRKGHRTAHHSPHGYLAATDLPRVEPTLVLIGLHGVDLDAAPTAARAALPEGIDLLPPE